MGPPHAAATQAAPLPCANRRFAARCACGCGRRRSCSMAACAAGARRSGRRRRRSSSSSSAPAAARPAARPGRPAAGPAAPARAASWAAAGGLRRGGGCVCVRTRARAGQRRWGRRAAGGPTYPAVDGVQQPGVQPARGELWGQRAAAGAGRGPQPAGALHRLLQQPRAGAGAELHGLHDQPHGHVRVLSARVAPRPQLPEHPLEVQCLRRGMAGGALPWRLGARQAGGRPLAAASGMIVPVRTPPWSSSAPRGWRNFDGLWTRAGVTPM
jgi:hypothetical protein